MSGGEPWQGLGSGVEAASQPSAEVGASGGLGTGPRGVPSGQGRSLKGTRRQRIAGHGTMGLRQCWGRAWVRIGGSLCSSTE